MLKKIFANFLVLNCALSIFSSNNSKLEDSTKSNFFDTEEVFISRLEDTTKLPIEIIINIGNYLSYVFPNLDFKKTNMLELIKKEGKEEHIYSCAFSKDYRYFVCADSGKLKIYDYTLNCRTFENIKALGLIDFCCDSNYLAVASDKKLEVYNLTEASLFKQFNNFTNEFLKICTSPVSRLIAVAIWGSGNIHLCNLDTGNKRELVDGNSKQILSILFSECGNYIFGTHSASNFGKINIWNVNLPKSTPIRTIIGHEERAIPGLGFSNGKLVSLGLDDTIRTWNWQISDCLEVRKFFTISPKKNFSSGFDFKFLTCSLDGKYIAFASLKSIKIFDLQNNQRRSYLFENLKQLFFTENSKFLVLVTDKCVSLIKIF